MGIAYWISPKGEIIDVQQKHINTVIRYPEKFGFTKHFVKFMYDKYKEKIGQEGKAREKLMLALFNEGWIRIRRYKTFWSINVNKLIGKQKTYIYEWAKKIFKGLHGFKELDPYMPVKIDQKGQKIKTIELKKMADSDKFVAEHKLIETVIEKMEKLKPYPIVNEYINNDVSFKTFKDYIING